MWYTKPGFIRTLPLHSFPESWKWNLGAPIYWSPAPIYWSPLMFLTASHQLKTQLQLVSKTRWKSVAYLLEPLLIRSSIKRLQKEDRGPHREPCQTDPKIFLLNFFFSIPEWNSNQYIQKAKKAENGCIMVSFWRQTRQTVKWSKIRKMLRFVMKVWITTS